MWYGNEVAMLLIGIGVLIMTFIYKQKIRTIPFWKYLLLSFYSLFIGWIATNAEGLIFPQFLNIVEHLSYAISSLFFLIWCWNITKDVNTAK